MTPGTKVVMVTRRRTEALLGTLDQPVLVGDERRWTVDWADGFKDAPDTTWEEKFLIPLVPQ